MRSRWMVAGAIATLLITSRHLFGGSSGGGELTAFFAVMDDYPAGNMSGVTMLDVLRALGLCFGLLIAVPALQCLTAVFTRQSPEALRNLAVWNTVWALGVTAIMAAFGIVPGIIVFAILGALFGVSLIPLRGMSPTDD